jgi:hypothetical protein
VKVEHRVQDVSGAKNHKLQLVDINSDLQTIPCTEHVVFYAGGESGIDHNSPMGRGRVNCHILLRVEDVNSTMTATAFHTYETLQPEMTLSMAADTHRVSEIEVVMPFQSDGFEWFHVSKWPIVKWANDPRKIQHLVSMLDRLSEISVGMIIEGVGKIDRFEDGGKKIIIIPDELPKPIVLQPTGVVGAMQKPA